MKFISKIFAFCVIVIVVASCGVNNSQKDNFQEIYNEFNGKYKPIKSYSIKPIDLNLDGKSSSNMFDELYNLQYSYLVILIIDEPSKYAENTYQFGLSWPHQIFPQNAKPGDIGFYPSFANQGVSRFFSFSSGRDSLIIHQGSGSSFYRNKFPIPESVVVENNHDIKVIIQRKLYTGDSWEEVTITTIYSRFTTET